MKKIQQSYKFIIKLILLALLGGMLSCGDTDYLSLSSREARLPGSGQNIANLNPEGSDILNTSTNHSAKDNEIRPKVNGLAGAVNIPIPSVNHFGTVSVQYPIDVPKGRAGMSPKVGLSYSSTGGDGLVGIGWNIGTGLGVISRTTRNGQLYYDERDEFTYNGQRLIKVSSGSGEDGTYRLEIESNFQRFELTESTDGGVWHVYDMGGTVTTFGADKNSRIYHPNDDTKTYSWNYTKSVDLNGNYMEAVYDTSEYNSNHILYLKEVRYTGNENEGFTPHQYVRFHLKERDEAYVSKGPGFIMKMDKILDYVEIGWDDPNGSDDTELWRYTMVYETSEDSNRQILKTVESNRTTTEPEFEYQPATHHFSWKVINNKYASDPEIDPKSTRYFEGDFNGDGISDMVFFNPEDGEWKAVERHGDGSYQFKSYANRYKDYDNDSKIQFFKGNVSGDYNGDGRSDIAFYLPETRTFMVAEHNGTNFEFKEYGRQNIFDLDIFRCEWFSGDYDGNGLSDSLLYDESTGRWVLMRNMGGRFEFKIISRHFQNLFRNDFDPDDNLDSTYTQDTSLHGKDRGKVHFLNGDYNGDGRTDISIYDQRSGKWWVGENHRDDSQHDSFFTIEWRVYKEFDAPEEALFGHDRFSGDFNGDGLSDFLLFDKAEGFWWIGETSYDWAGNGNIQFRKYSRTPQHRDITRWLQGDFNGDGRTDIGFYSKTDGNFWIGESIPNGFRYRIYSNMSYGPDSERVLQKAPLPQDEVRIQGASTVMATASNAYKVDYKFNGNYHNDRGETVFVGAFSKEEPELLIFNKLEDTILFKSGDGDPIEVLTDIDLEGDDVRILNQNKPRRFRGRDGILYYEKDENMISDDSHSFNLIHYDSGFTNTVLAEFDDIENFDITGSLHLTDSFKANDSDSYVLVLDDQRIAGGAQFVLFNGATRTNLTITGDDTAQWNTIFSASKGSGDRHRRRVYTFFSGRFTVDAASDGQVLMVDRTGYPHKWYLGTVNLGGGTIDFQRLTVSGESTFYSNGYTNQFRVRDDGSLVYASNVEGRTQFHRVVVSGTSMTQTDYYPLGEGISFRGEFDSENNPVIHTTQGIQKVILGSSQSLQNLVTQNRTIQRPDLYEQLYPFRWIQGDYNGDGKTDIGIFHLKEPEWYFANTVGTVPDMMYKVRNGIGGRYELAYENSTTFDNTGDDDVPDLPMNYKVCTKITVDNGFGNRIFMNYDYEGDSPSQRS